jgi:hypothetical protein
MKNKRDKEQLRTNSQETTKQDTTRHNVSDIYKQMEEKFRYAESMFIRYIPQGYDTMKVKVRFTELIDAARNNRLDPERLKSMSAAFDSASRDNAFSKEEADHLLELLKKTIITEEELSGKSIKVGRP